MTQNVLLNDAAVLRIGMVMADEEGSGSRCRNRQRLLLLERANTATLTTTKRAKMQGHMRIYRNRSNKEKAR